MLRVLNQRRAWLAVFAAVAALFAVLEALNAAPVAHAEPRRRLCNYIEKVPTQVKIPRQALIHPVKNSSFESYTVAADLYVAVNYKKHGACPKIEDPYNIAGDSTRQVRLAHQQPVPKDECEDWGRTIGSTSAYLGTISVEDVPLKLAMGKNPFLVDVCSQMANDSIYEFYVVSENISYTDGTVFHQGTFFTNKRYNARD